MCQVSHVRIEPSQFPFKYFSSRRVVVIAAVFLASQVFTKVNIATKIESRYKIAIFEWLNLGFLFFVSPWCNVFEAFRFAAIANWSVINATYGRVLVAYGVLCQSRFK